MEDACSMIGIRGWRIAVKGTTELSCRATEEESSEAINIDNRV